MSNTITPEVTWAQRSNANDPTKNIVYLTIITPDVAEGRRKLDLQPNKLSYEGTSSKDKHYAVDLDFFDEIDVENSKTKYTGRGVEMVLRKKVHKAEFWPRLLKDKKKVHFLKTDFDKWVDEDEQEEEEEGGFYKNMGMDEPEFGGLDFSKLGGGDPSIPTGNADDSDDEDMPELEDTDAAAHKESNVDDDEGQKAETPNAEGEGEKKTLIQEMD